MSVFNNIVISLHGRMGGFDKDGNLIVRGLRTGNEAFDANSYIYTAGMFGGDAQAAADACGGRALYLEGGTVVLAVPSQYATVQAAYDATAQWAFGEGAFAWIEVSGHLDVASDYILQTRHANSAHIGLRGANAALTKTIASSGHSAATVATSVARYRYGSGYTPGTYTGLAVDGGTYTTQATLDVTVGADGLVSAVAINNPGSYSVAPVWPHTVTGLSGGSGAQFSINWTTSCVLALADVSNVSAGDVLVIDAPTYRSRQWRWGYGAQDGSICGRLSVTGTAMTLTSQTHDLLEVGDLIFCNGESRQITARASATSFTIDSAFTTTVPDSGTPDPDAESIVGAFYWQFIKARAGTISTSGRSTTVTGSGTTFTDYAIGDYLFAFGIGVRITAIASDTSLTVETAQEYPASTPFAIHTLALGWCGAFRVAAVGAGTVSFSNMAQTGQLILSGKQIDGGTVTILRDVLRNTSSGNGVIADGFGLGSIERIGLAGSANTSGVGVGTAVSLGLTNKPATVVLGSNVGITDFGSGLFSHFGDVHAAGVAIGNIRGTYAALNYQGSMWLHSAKISTGGSIGIFCGVGSSTYHSYSVVVGGVIGIYKIAGGMSYADGAQYICPRISGVQTIAGGGGHDTEAWVWGSLIGLNYAGSGTSARFAGAKTVGCTTGCYAGPGVNVEGNYTWATGGSSRGFRVESEAMLIGAQATGNGQEGFLCSLLGGNIYGLRSIARRNGTYGFVAEGGARIDAESTYSRYNVTADYFVSGIASRIDTASAIYASSVKTTTVGSVDGWMQGELPVAYGGTGGTTAAAARNNIKPAYGILLSETEALVNAMTTRPKRARTFLMDDTIQALKDAGLWDLVLAMWVLAAADSQAAWVNWKNPGVATLIPTNSPAHTPNQGVQGDGLTSWLDSGITLASLTGYAQNDAGMFAWSRTDSDNVGRDIGLSTNFNASVLPRSGGNLQTRANDGTTTSTAVADSLGLSGWTRDASGTYSQFRNSAIIASPSVASTGVPGGNISLLRSSTAYSPREIAIGGVTKALTSDQIASLYTILQYHLIEVGAI